MKALLVGSREPAISQIRRILENQHVNVRHQHSSGPIPEAVREKDVRLIVIVEPGDADLEACREIRHSTRPQPIILAICGSVHENRLEKLWTAGVDDYMRVSILEESESIRRLRWTRIQAAHERLDADFRSLFSASPDGMVITTPEGQLLSANKALLDLSGYSRQELRGKNVLELYVDPSRRIQFREKLEREGKVRDFEVRLYRKDGSERICQLTAGLRRNLAGKPVTFQSIVRDITQRREMERDLMRISEEERRRIGRDLHDGPAASLSGLDMVLHGFARRMRRGQSIEPSELEQVAEIVRRESEETRILAHGLDPVGLENGHLIDALETLRRNIEFVYGTACRLETPEELPELPREQALHIYRIIQEATTNAGRHADPDNIWMRLDVTNGDLLIEVEDNGSGFEQTSERKGLGLRTIRYRVEVLGGSIDITSDPKKGTVLSILLPLSEPIDGRSS